MFFFILFDEASSEEISEMSSTVRDFYRVGFN